jgi:glycosyltransferase involved in cell wall biosynthesis
MSTLPSDNLLPSGFPLAVPLPAAPREVALPPQPAIETIRVLHLINGEHYAGAERVQDLLAKCLPELGFRVGFACVKLDLFDAMRGSRAAPLYDVPMWSRLDLLAARKVANIIRHNQYRILHAHTVRTAMLGAVAAPMAGVPLVYHAHSPASHDSTRRWRDLLNGVVERLSLRRAARVIAVSEALARHVAREGCDAAKIRVVHNGVPYPAVLRDSTPPDGKWTLGVTALFRPRKGIEVLLESMAILRSRAVPVHLRAVGMFESPKYQAEIAARVQKLKLGDHVTWTGFTRDVAGELAQMDLFVLPSLFGEGLPMVVLEAMAAGVPVVATGVAGVPEAVRHGRDGLIAAPGDAEDLAGAIAGVIRGEYDWSTLRINALARHAQRFSDRSMAAGVAAVYRELLESRRELPENG